MLIHHTALSRETVSWRESAWSRRSVTLRESVLSRESGLLCVLGAVLLITVVGCGAPNRAAHTETRRTSASAAPAPHETRGVEHGRERIEESLPLVAVVTTGGTIAMKQDAAAGGAVPALSGAMLVEAVPALRELARLRVAPVCNIDSRRMSPELWLAQLAAIRAELADPAVVGVVVTHGTDTMEDSAFFLELVLGREKPVVYTGAARSADTRDADGPRNLLNAVRQVLDPQAAQFGVTLTLGGEIHAAEYATKQHTNHPDGFDSGRFGPVGEHDGRGVVWLQSPPPEREPPRAATVARLVEAGERVAARGQAGARGDGGAQGGAGVLPRVEVVHCYPGATGRALDAAVEAGAAGVIVVGYGLGNVNDAYFEAIKRARARGVAIVLTSRVPHGRVYSEYGGAGGGASLRELGVVLRNDLPPHKLRIALMLWLLEDHGG